MVVRAFVFETRGGALLHEVTPTEETFWSATANKAEDINLRIDLTSAEEVDRDWANLATPWKHSIALDIGGRLFGGPILPTTLVTRDSVLRVKARGFRALLEGRSVLPLAALTGSLTLENGDPDPAMDTVLSGLDLGSIGRAISVQAMEWPGWTDLPVEFPPARAGTHEQTYEGVDRKNLDEALSDLSGLQKGPDIRFQLYWDGSDRFKWVYESGTEAQPRLQGPSVFAWEPGQGSDLTVESNPTRMGSMSWSEGGRATDEVLIRSLYDPTLIDIGFPLLELESRASSTTSRTATLDSWNAETLRTARKPWEFWSFKIRTDQSPFPNEYNIGDLIEVTITKDRPVPGKFIPAGTYTRRIAGLSGDLGGDGANWVTVTCGEVYDA